MRIGSFVIEFVFGIGWRVEVGLDLFEGWVLEVSFVFIYINFSVRILEEWIIDDNFYFRLIYVIM